MSGNNISELNNLFAQINQISGDKIGTQKFADGSMSFNDVAWFSNAVQGLGSDSTPEQKAANIQGLVKKALSIFEKFANSEAKAAQKEVKNETKKSEELLKKSQEVGVALEGKFTDIASSIEEQTSIVEDASKLIKETQKSLEEKQKQIEELAKQIEEKQKSLEGKTPKEQAVILGEIQGLAAAIANIGISIQEDNENLQNLTTTVENTSKNIDDAAQQMTVIEQDGAAQIQQLGQQAGAITAEVSQTGVTGGTNKVTGIAAEKAANAASSNVFTGASVAPKLHQLAQDQGAAGNTRISSIAGNINRIAQGIGGLNNAAQIISNFQNSIGGAVDNYAAAYGSWNTAVEPVITSIGSLTAITEGVEELNEAVETDLASVGNVSDKENENNTQAELQTLNFDINKLRQFGI